MKYLTIILLLFSLNTVFASDTLIVEMPEMNVNPGDDFVVDVKVLGFENVVGSQFTFIYDEEVINYLSVDNFAIAGINKNTNFGIPDVENGSISFLWYDFLAQPVSLEDESTLFSIHFKAVGENGEYSDLELDTSSTILSVIEFSNQDGQVIPYKINKGKVTIGSVGVNDYDLNDFEIGGFYPSVVDNQTSLNIQSPVSVEVKYDIIDLTGKVLSSGITDLVEGENKLDFTAEGLPKISGTYFAEINIGNQKIARKFIKM
jgi:hypothetical protein